jgi:hypothetical protein
MNVGDYDRRIVILMGIQNMIYYEKNWSHLRRDLADLENLHQDIRHTSHCTIPEHCREYHKGQIREIYYIFYRRFKL